MQVDESRGVHVLGTAGGGIDAVLAQARMHACMHACYTATLELTCVAAVPVAAFHAAVRSVIAATLTWVLFTRC